MQVLADDRNSELKLDRKMNVKKPLAIINLLSKYRIDRLNAKITSKNENSRFLTDKVEEKKKVKELLKFHYADTDDDIHDMVRDIDHEIGELEKQLDENKTAAAKLRRKVIIIENKR